MQVLLVRHGRAEEREKGKKDEVRALTEDGQQRLRKEMKKLSRTLPKVDLIATSPLVRATQTALIMSKACDDAKVVKLPALAPKGTEEAVFVWLKKQPAEATIALVGHEPNMGALAAYLMLGVNEAFFGFKKGGVCCIEFDPASGAGGGELQWLMQPKQIRNLK